MDFKKDIALIQEVLTDGLSHIKPKPQIWLEVNERACGLDVWIISRGFAKMMLHERHNLVFSLFDQKLPPETDSIISYLLIYTPKELHYEMPWEQSATCTESDAGKTDGKESHGGLASFP